MYVKQIFKKGLVVCTILFFIGMRPIKKHNKIVIQFESYAIDILLVFLIVYSLFVIPWFHRYTFENHNLQLVKKLDDPMMQEELRNNMVYVLVTAYNRI